MGNREQVKNSIRGAAGGCNAGDGVLEGCAGKNLLRQTLPGHEFHNETAYCLRLAHLRWMSRGNTSAPHRCDSKKLADHGHRVCRSEERRVGKECGLRGGAEHWKEKSDQ